MKNIRKKYTNINKSGAFAGLDGFKKAQDLQNSHKEIKNMLLEETGYYLHHPAIKKFPRRRVYVPGIFMQFGSDLIDIQKFKNFNYKKKYILVVMDMFSKMAWLEALNNKCGTTVVKGLKAIFARSKGVCKSLQTDAGREYLNGSVQDYLKLKSIHPFTTHSELKCCVVERFNRTIMGKIMRYMTTFKTKRFTPKLRKFENLYNQSYHRSIKCRPIDVNKSNELQIHKNLYGEKE